MKESEYLKMLQKLDIGDAVPPSPGSVTTWIKENSLSRISIIYLRKNFFGIHQNTEDIIDITESISMDTQKEYISKCFRELHENRYTVTLRFVFGKCYYSLYYDNYRDKEKDVIKCTKYNDNTNTTLYYDYNFKTAEQLIYKLLEQE